MKLFNIFKGKRRNSIKKIAATAVVFVTVAAAGFAGISAYTNNKASASDCTGNSIMQCGATSRTQFIQKVQASPELQKIYAQWGLPASDYNRFITDAVPGVAYASDNTIKVGGRIVATNVWSIGRWASYQGSGYITDPVAGAGTYYGNYNNKAFASSSTTIPVDVLYNAQGQMQFAVMTSSCGNPAKGTPTTPTYQCTDLQTSSLGNNSYSFTTNASASNGATISKLVYNFGDGSAEQTTTNPATAVSHTFTKDSNVTVSVYISLPGGGTAVLTNCTHPIKFTPPPAVYTCDLLTMTGGAIDNKGNQTYTLAAKASVTNATVQSYTYIFGDGSTQTVNSASTTHVYAPGTWTAKVSVNVLTDTGNTDTVTSADCQKSITVKPLVSTLTCVDLGLTAGTTSTTTGATPYTLTAKASATNATITSYVFDFGDNSQSTTVTSADTTATTDHTYAPGTYTVTVTVNGKDSNDKAITATAPACQKSITVKPLVGALTCDDLTLTPGAVNSTTGETAYTLTGKATATNATIANYVFDFGDGSAASINSTANSASTNHTYAPGTWTAIVTVNGKDLYDKTLSATAPSCKQAVTVKVPECKPGVPVGSPQCMPSVLTCVDLTMTPGDVDSSTGATTYTLAATAAASNATITSYDFNFGDNSTATTVTTGNTTASTTHTYQVGTWAATVTVNGKDASGAAIQATAASCKQEISVKVPECKPGVPQGNNECFTYTCNLLSITKGDNRTVTLSNFSATSTNPNATLAGVVVDWGDNNQQTYTSVVGQQHQYNKDGTYTITAVAHFTANDKDIPAGGSNCAQTVSFTTPIPVQPATLVNTGAGSTFGIFAVIAIVGTLGHRLFLGRRLSRDS